MTTHDRPFGRHLEDFNPGDVYKHWPGKTITEYDDHLFCMITMNHHPLHTNEWFAENETVQKQERRRREPRVLARARHERAGRERRRHRQPRDRVAAARQAHLPRRHHLRRHQGARREGDLEGRPGHRHGRDQGHQPARRGGLLLPPQADGVEAGPRAAAPSSPTTTTPSSTASPPGEAMPIDDVAARGFGAGAAAYEVARPGYPDEAARLLAASSAIGAGHPGLRPGRRHRQADPAPGRARRRASSPSSRSTGMRDELARTRARGSRSVDGTAEAIPLPDASVDVVTVAQAFHWFDAPPPWPRSPACCARRRAGHPVERARRAHGVGGGDEPAHPVARAHRLPLPARRLGRGRRRTGRFTPLEEQAIAWDQPMTRELLADRVRSISYIAAMPPAERERLRRRGRRARRAGCPSRSPSRTRAACSGATALTDGAASSAGGRAGGATCRGARRATRGRCWCAR